jgi:hypothetical protein
MLTRRPTDFGDGPVPDDYQIREDGQVVGRIYKAVNVTKDPWVWSITARQPQTGSDKGKAETLDDALKAFRAAWERR